jgi:hypothetical protein
MSARDWSNVDPEKLSDADRATLSLEILRDVRELREQIVGLGKTLLEENAKQLKVLREHLLAVGPRADGNYNAGDFMWALDRAIEELEG